MKTASAHRISVISWVREVMCLFFLIASHSLYSQGCACPPVATCFACSGGLVSLKLEYNEGGIITDMTAADDDGPLPTTFQGAVITIPSRTTGQPFNGDVLVTVDKLLQASDTQKFKTNCGPDSFVGQSLKHFKVLAAASVAGPLCCKDSDADKITPQFGTTCPADIQVTNTGGSCSTAVTWTPPTATDNCGDVTVTSTHQPGDVFGIGPTTVTYTATDDYGNKKECSFKINVKDGTKPLIANCPSSLSIDVGTSGCNAVATWTEPTASDDCSLVSFTSNRAPGASFPIGTTTVTYTAKDAANNVEICSFTVTVTDKVSPQITNCPQNIVTTINGTSCTTTASWIVPTATDNCGIQSLTTDHAPGSAFPSGTTTVTYTAKDASGNTATCSFTVTVTDKTIPVFTKCVTSDIVVNAQSNCQATATWPVPVASDNCTSPVLTSTHQPGSVFSTGTTTVTYTAKDASGNTATCSFRVVVKDKTAPTIQCVADIVTSTGSTCNALVTWKEPTTTDCSAVTLVSEPASGSPFPLGTTTVTYVATDASGNSSQCTFKVTVNDNTPPVFNSCITPINATADASCSATVSWIAPVATDNCSEITLSSSHSPGSTFASGITRVTYTARDAAGNSSTCQFDVVVNDPNTTISNCPSDIKILADQSGSMVVNWAEPTVQSNCSNATMTSTHLPGESFTIGTTPVVYSVAGTNGIISSCQFNVIVLPREISFDVMEVVSPNGDGVNDVWTLPRIEQFKNNKVILFDRWGGLIYEADGYDNDLVVWNGTNKGTTVPNGTYFYTITVQAEDQEVKRKGFIELIR